MRMLVLVRAIRKSIYLSHKQVVFGFHSNLPG